MSSVGPVGRVALVTGANQGLGLALVRGLAEHFDGKGDRVYLTGRDAERVERAAAELGDAGLSVIPELMDVSDADSVARLSELAGPADVVISNAAARIVRDVPFREQVRAFVDTNNHGTTRMLRAFGPRLAPGGRMIVVASSFGTLRELPASLHDRFETDSLEQIDDVMDDYVSAVERGEAEEWPSWINIPSKVGQVAAMRASARTLAPDRFVAAACPGLVDTEASRPWFEDMSVAQAPAEAAVDVLRLATGPLDPRWRGELVQHLKVLPWR